ncbi:MAG: MarR family transcriptional regulator [Candidatus Lokiarchaeota archaeon]|nr:MarR family transcriptional regulator [Candidatus Lokiarchaeota archaeon]
MNSLEDIKTEFIHIYERIAERRGLPGIVGRIMGVLFLEKNAMNQKKLSELTGYSISSISRALDQMIRLGIIEKRKHKSNEYYIYEMKSSFIDLAIMGLKRWIQQAEISKSEISKLEDKIYLKTIKSNNLNEAENLKNALNTFVNEINKFTEELEKMIKNIS